MAETIVHGRYSILSTLGGGGMARVYLAHDEVLGRDVAIKILRDQYAEDAEFVERFKREARSAASLSHPNIVSVYDRGVADDGTSYIAMEHVSGGSLKERISREGALGADPAIGVALQITDALEAAHGRGVIHRDIKPHNVLVTSTGDVKVADFGIARAASYTSISQTSLVLGTAGYMSPEQALGEPVDPRSDLYSLGVVLYEMLTGELPYTADNPVAVSMKHVNEPLRPPKELNPGIPQDVDAVVTKLLAKNPRDRYQGATELSEDLRRVRDGLPPLATDPVDVGTKTTRAETRKSVPPPPPTPTRRRRRRSTPWVLAAILLLLALLGGLGWALSQNGGNGGNARVEVPSVEGMAQEQAQQKLEAAGLQSEIEQRESSEGQAGTVLEQSPNGGEQAKRGSSVTLVVSSGPAAPSTIAVPEVVNMGYADAEATLIQAGLAVGNVQQLPSNTVAEGVVIAQGYDAGVQVDSGTAVNLEISSGPPPAPTPDTSDQNDPAPAQPDQPQQPQQQEQQEPQQQSGEQQPSPQQQPQQQQDLNDQIQDQVDEQLEDAGIKEAKGKDKEDKKNKDD